MTPTLFVILSVSITILLHQSLKWVIWPIIEKAHEYLRAEPRNSGVERSREKAA